MILIGLAGAAAAVVAFGRNTAEEPDTEPDDGDDMAPPPKPIAVGKPSDPAIAALLKSMEAVFVQAGVNVSWFSPREVTKMTKAPGGESAIPPQAYWPRMATTIVEVAQPIRQQLGLPFAMGGYRPPDYNKAVGGKPGSRHQWFEALDLRIAGSQNTAANREKLKNLAAMAYVMEPGAPMGLGIYSGNIHVDYGWKRRTWEQAQKYIKAVQATVAPPKPEEEDDEEAHADDA